jgi:hypothetical protein
MTLERLDWILWKQRDIVTQIQHIMSGQKIDTIGNFPSYYTPQHLINFQRDRYNILEKAKSCKEETLNQWLESARKRRGDFVTEDEINLLTQCLKK